jgi:hypothetical protein
MIVGYEKVKLNFGMSGPGLSRVTGPDVTQIGSHGNEPDTF